MDRVKAAGLKEHFMAMGGPGELHRPRPGLEINEHPSHAAAQDDTQRGQWARLDRVIFPGEGAIGMVTSSSESTVWES
jgi:hypothetical protein